MSSLFQKFKTVANVPVPVPELESRLRTFVYRGIHACAVQQIAVNSCISKTAQQKAL